MTEAWCLVVVGKGSDEERLRRLARSLKVEHRVDFRGWLSRDRVLDAMRQEADIFVFPSLHDESPLAVVEALGCGLP